MQTDELPDCLHCAINQLVEERAGEDGANVAELAEMIAESLVDLILMLPESAQPKLMAHTLAYFGDVFLQKSGAAPEGTAATH
jgi:hypothetical protein